MSSQQKLREIFDEIDTNKDGFITRHELESTPYAQSLFENNPNALHAFSIFTDNKMGFNDFALLANSQTFKLHDLAIAKFEASKLLSKYLSVSAPGEAGPSVKQSYLRLVAESSDGAPQQLHTVGIEVGVDKPLQEQKIKKITEALGHPPHQVFFLLKFQCSSEAQGPKIAETLQSLLHEVITLGKDLAPELADMLNVLKVYARYNSGYIYLVVEVDNPFIDGIVSFLNEVALAISPECSLRFKAQLKSNLQHLLKNTFSYEKSNGEVLIEFDIDNTTLHKLREILGDNVEGDVTTPPNQLFLLLFEELRLSATFTSLGQALSSTFQQDISSFPTPSLHVQTIKEMGIRETVGQFFEGAPAFLDLLKENCRFEGELSLNFHDFFIRVDFDLDIQQAFDLL